MKDIWKPKHTVWFKKNDDDELGKKPSEPKWEVQQSKEGIVAEAEWEEGRRKSENKKLFRPKNWAYTKT